MTIRRARLISGISGVALVAAAVAALALPTTGERLAAIAALALVLAAVRIALELAVGDCPHVRCGWCGVLLRRGTWGADTSHGICPGCRDIWLTEARSARAARKGQGE